MHFSFFQSKLTYLSGQCVKLNFMLQFHSSYRATMYQANNYAKYFAFKINYNPFSSYETISVHFWSLMVNISNRKVQICSQIHSSKKVFFALQRYCKYCVEGWWMQIENHVSLDDYDVLCWLQDLLMVVYLSNLTKTQLMLAEKLSLI